VFQRRPLFGASRTAAEREDGNHDWPNHGNDLANTRFQNLDQINPNNVKNLKVAWVFHTGVLDPLAELEATPIEVDGRYSSPTAMTTCSHECHHGADALEVDGFNDEAQLAAFFLCCGRNNHGVAFGDDTVFVGRLTIPSWPVNAKATGKVLWQSTVADFHDRGGLGLGVVLGWVRGVVGVCVSVGVSIQIRLFLKCRVAHNPVVGRGKIGFSSISLSGGEEDGDGGGRRFEKNTRPREVFARARSNSFSYRAGRLGRL